MLGLESSKAGKHHSQGTRTDSKEAAATGATQMLSLKSSKLGKRHSQVSRTASKEAAMTQRRNQWCNQM